MRDVVLIAGVVAIGLYISFTLAEHGHPTSVWLWRDVFRFSP
jgi:ketopantoate reductase